MPSGRRTCRLGTGRRSASPGTTRTQVTEPYSRVLGAAGSGRHMHTSPALLAQSAAAAATSTSQLAERRAPTPCRDRPRWRRPALLVQSPALLDAAAGPFLALIVHLSPSDWVDQCNAIESGWENGSISTHLSPQQPLQQWHADATRIGLCAGGDGEEGRTERGGRGVPDEAARPPGARPAAK